MPIKLKKKICIIKHISTFTKKSFQGSSIEYILCVVVICSKNQKIGSVGFKKKSIIPLCPKANVIVDYSIQSLSQNH